MIPKRIIPQSLPFVDKSDAEAVYQAIIDNWITEGQRSADFVNALTQLIGVKYAVLAPNGTLALALGLMALNIGAGDEVLVPDITFAGSASAVVMVGAVPVFTDVDPINFQFDVIKAEKCITSKTRAIMPVHLYGTACDMDAITAFADRHKLLIIEDAAQGIGVKYKGRHVGSFGNIGCFSFFADKTITTGEGGLVTCNDEETFNRLNLLRNQGRMNRGSFIHPSIGFNFRMTDMQSAMGLNQLSKLDHIIAAKETLYQKYLEGLTGIAEVAVLGAEKDSNYIPFRCVIIARRADDLKIYLEANGIQVRSFFYPLHKQPCFEAPEIGPAVARIMDDDAYQTANNGYKNGICLPIYPALTIAEVQYITTAISNFYA